ncbi:MAG: hypothetical protein D6761_12255 [Candidatus Dadabacteria bacterium]|nr:MAG: hypothetical protein D6761_12255 [Candidatus Dadabacteria bacterium]
MLLVDRDAGSTALLRAVLPASAVVERADVIWVGPWLRRLRPRLIFVEPAGFNVVPRSVAMAVSMLARSVHPVPVYLFSILETDVLERLSAEYQCAGFLSKHPAIEDQQRRAIDQALHVPRRHVAQVAFQPI